MRVWFYTVGEDSAGGLSLRFRSPPKYWLLACSSSNTDFPTALPTETDKIWTITLTGTSGTVRVIIHCNNKEVLNVVVSDTTCGQSIWSTRWSKDVEKIYFSSCCDTASDYYRPGKQMRFISCLLPILL